MYVKAAVFLSCFVLSYLVLVLLARDLWQGLAAAVVLALSVTGIGFNVMHDGGHRSFSERRWVNRLAAATLDLVERAHMCGTGSTPYIIITMSI